MSAVASVLTRPACGDCGDPAAALDGKVRLWRESKTGQHLTLCAQHAWTRAPFDFTWLPAVPCETCGVDVIRSAGLASRRHVYCGPEHGELGPRLRQQAKREVKAEQRQRELAAIPKRLCVCGCGEWFQPSDPTQKYPNGTHRVRAHRLCRLGLYAADDGQHEGVVLTGAAGSRSIVDRPVGTPREEFVVADDLGDGPNENAMVIWERWVSDGGRAGHAQWAAELAEALVAAARGLDGTTARPVAPTQPKWICCSPGCHDDAGHGDRGNFCPEHGALLDRIRDEFDGQPRRRRRKEFVVADDLGDGPNENAGASWEQLVPGRVTRSARRSLPRGGVLCVAA